MNNPKSKIQNPKSLPRQRAKEIASLAHRKYRERHGEVLVEGTRAVASALAAGAPLVEVVLSETVWRGEAGAALAARAGVPVYVLPDGVVARLSNVETSQGVLAVVRTCWLDAAALPARRTVLALDGVQDPGNVGALLRTAAWFGAEAVVAGPGTADLYHPKVVRAAMGAHWDLGLARSTDLPAVLHRLRQAGHACYGADLEGKLPVRGWTPAPASVLVMGSEAHGLSPAVAACLDARVTIDGAPGRQGTESLNVAVAGGILLHAWLRGAPDG